MEKRTLTPPLIKWGWLRAILGLTIILASYIPVYSLYNYVVKQTALSWDQLTSLAVVLPVFIVVLYLLRRFIDRKSSILSDFSLANMKCDIAFGILLSSTIMTVTFVALYTTGYISIVKVDFIGSSLVYYFLYVLVMTSMEEIALRGYLLDNLKQSMNKYVAVILSSVVYGLLHLGNDNADIVGIVSIILLGIAVGIYYVHRRNLWMPIVFHCFWNFVMGVIYGSPISGQPYEYSLIETDLTGPELITGGAFGYESSLLVMVFAIVAILFVQMKFKSDNKDQ